VPLGGGFAGGPGARRAMHGLRRSRPAVADRGSRRTRGTVVRRARAPPPTEGAGCLPESQHPRASAVESTVDVTVSTELMASSLTSEVASFADDATERTASAEASL